MRKIYFSVLAVLPYLVAGMLILLFVNNELTEIIFQGSIFTVAIPLALLIAVTFWLTYLCVYKSLKNKWDAYTFVRTMTVIKLIHIPAYIAIFIIGTICMITVFTRAFTLLLAVFDFVLILMSGSMTFAAMLRTKDEYPSVFRKCIWALPLQFVYCADVIAVVIFYLRLKAENKNTI